MTKESKVLKRFFTTVFEPGENPEPVLTKSHMRSIRRKNNYTKAIRKKNISKSKGLISYDNLHEFSKNKIHCSCNMCKFRSKSNPDQKTIADIRRYNAMELKQKEYDNHNCLEDLEYRLFNGSSREFSHLYRW